MVPLAKKRKRIRFPTPKTAVRWVISHLCWRARLGGIGPRSILFKPILVRGARKIYIGNNTVIRDGARLEVIVRDDVGWVPRMRIGDQVNIEQGVHIVCHCEITIEDDVSIGPYCVLLDVSHPFDPPDTFPKIGDRLPDHCSRLRIGRGSLIGAHCVILPNVMIGRGCVIGAGAVVTKSLPDYCVAVGAPARIIRRFDLVERHWEVS